MRLVTFERLTGDIIVEQSGLMGREIRRGPGIRGQRGRCSKWWRSNVSAANIPQNRRTDVVYCISSWWRDISAVTVDPLGYPQMWRKPHSPSTSIYIYIYILYRVYRERTTTSLAIRGFDKNGTGYLSYQPEILGQ